VTLRPNSPLAGPRFRPRKQRDGRSVFLETPPGGWPTGSNRAHWEDGPDINARWPVQPDGRRGLGDGAALTRFVASVGRHHGRTGTRVPGPWAGSFAALAFIPHGIRLASGRPGRETAQYGIGTPDPQDRLVVRTHIIGRISAAEYLGQKWLLNGDGSSTGRVGSAPANGTIERSGDLANTSGAHWPAGTSP